MVTQPLMYKKIAQHPGTRRLYADKLVAAGVITPEEPDAMIATYRAAMDKGLHTNTTILSNYKPPMHRRLVAVQEPPLDRARTTSTVPLEDAEGAREARSPRCPRASSCIRASSG